jgi:hypothetical protein
MAQDPTMDGRPPTRAAWWMSLVVVLVVPGLVVPGLGWAADEEIQADEVCADDIRQFCPDVKPGSSRVVECLQKNKARVSAACGARLDASHQKAKALIEEFGRSCRRDVDRFCPGVDPGGGRVLGCLRQHQPELSPPCQGEMNRIADARDRVATLRSACRADAETLCRNVPQLAGPLLECLQANEAKLSPDCNAADVRQALNVASLVDVVEEMGNKDRILEALEILQGIDSVAFARSQILIQVDGFTRYQDVANSGVLTFNPQFVFGRRNEFAVQAKVPLLVSVPTDPSYPTMLGVGTLFTSFTWNFFAQGQVRQYLGLGMQWETATFPVTGYTWGLVPSYAVAVGLARWVSLTTQVYWMRSLGTSDGYQELNQLWFEPILVFNLPGRTFLALDTKLGWDFFRGTFAPVMKGVGGIFVDRQRSVSISAWYQAALTSAAVPVTFKYGVGLGLAYYFDW